MTEPSHPDRIVIRPEELRGNSAGRYELRDGSFASPFRNRRADRLWVARSIVGVVLLALLGFVVAGKLAQSRHAERGGRTLEYWQQARAITETPLPDDESAIAELRRRADRLEALQVVGIDPEASQTCLQLAGVFRKVADLYERNPPSTVFVKAFLTALMMGDFRSTAQQLDADIHQLQDEVQHFVGEASHARTQLTSRYQIEFPALVLPGF